MYGSNAGYTATTSGSTIPASTADSHVTSHALRNASQLQQVLISEQNENSALRYKLQSAREEISLRELFDSLIYNKAKTTVSLSYQESHEHMDW